MSKEQAINEINAFSEQGIIELYDAISNLEHACNITDYLAEDTTLENLHVLKELTKNKAILTNLLIEFLINRYNIAELLKD